MLFPLLVVLTTASRVQSKPDVGPGEPILLVTNPAYPFTRYYAEILRNEGLNEFAVKDIGTLSQSTLGAFDVVVLGEMPLTPAQVTMFTKWVTSGGNLITMRPDPQLADLLGLGTRECTLSNGYLLIDTRSEPGAGLVGETIQFHGSADLYNVGHATALAVIYSSATSATISPAVTVHSVGSKGGQAAAFAYDLARSVVYTRQGNPAWAGQKRDGEKGPIRSDDLFFGAASFDPQPDWIDLNKVAIPQADEQQRLLANMILAMNLDRKPLPRFWYLPRGERAAIVMTADDHAKHAVGPVERFNNLIEKSPPNCSVAKWECLRSTAYISIFPNSPYLTNVQVVSFQDAGFEVALHVYTGGGSLADGFSSQLGSWKSILMGTPMPKTERNHSVGWIDWVSQAKTELANGIRLDTNYYYWPPKWIQNRPGMFTGSGMPMRFADSNGATIDVYQATTQMTDESGQSYPFNVDTLLDNAIGPRGYYGVFTTNIHTDDPFKYWASSSEDSDAIVASAQARRVPVISARQILEWLDARNGSTFPMVAWSGHTLRFTIKPGVGANGLQALVPVRSAVGRLGAVMCNNNPIQFARETIKGVEYASFDAIGGNYSVTYLVQNPNHLH